MTKAREAIAAGYKAFEQAFYRGDADTISQMYTEDAELLIPEVPLVRGREAIAQVWKSILGSGGKHGTREHGGGARKRRLGVRGRHIYGQRAGWRRSKRRQVRRDLEPTSHRG